MKLKTLIYSVVISVLCLPGNAGFAQSVVPPAEQQPAVQVAPPAKMKRSVNPESIKRAKLTRLRKDIALTEDQIAKVKPIIDTYVTDMQAIKADLSLDSRTRRQKSSEARQKYDRDLDGVLNPDQQQKLASVREERRARLRAARTGQTSTQAVAPSGSAGTPPIVQ